jgi:protein O-mannosyl-transferase
MKAVFPYEMSPLYPYPNEMHVGFRIALLVGFPAFVLLTYWLWRKGYKAIVFGIGVLFFNVVFMLQILGAGQGFIADRFTYIPYLGLFFIAAYYFDQIIKNENSFKMGAIGIAALYMVFSAWKSVDQIKVWKNGGSLWSHVTKYYPGTEMPWGNKGNFLRSNKMYKEALTCYDKAIEIKPSKPTTYNSRGKTYFDMSDGDKITNINKAMTDYTKGIGLIQVSPDSLKKDYGEIYVNRGAALGLLSTMTRDTLMRKNHLLQAAKDISQGKKLDPKNKNAYLNGYLVNSELGRYEQCLDDIENYIKISPNEGDMYYEKGRILNVLKRHNEAIAPINEALRLGDKRQDIMAVFYLERARAELNSGDKANALKDAQTARTMNPATVPDALFKQFQ